jgi:ribosomal protein S18 acetylase RimI-like enzyme
MGKLNCRRAHVEEIPWKPPAFERYRPHRVRLAKDAQAATYLDFMSPSELDRLQAGNASASWDWETGPPIVVLNANVQNELVGIADVRTQRPPWNRYAIVEPLYVKKACWRQGVGRKLWQAGAAAAAVADGIVGMQVVSLDENTRARQFYEGTLGLRKVSDESLTIGEHVFLATRYEVPEWR